MRLLDPVGPLEREVMKGLWNLSSSTVAEITSVLNEDRSRPLSTKTILTCLTRLETKGLVTHTKLGRAFCFLPSMTEEEMDTWHIEQGMAAFIDRYGDLAVAVFAARICADPKHRLMVRRLLEAHDEGGRT